MGTKHTTNSIWTVVTIWTPGAGLSVSAQLACSLGSCSNRGHNGVAQAAGFQGFNSGHGGSPWAGDHLPQFSRMKFRFTDHLRRTEYGLDRQLEGDFSRQPHHHPAVCEGFNK